MPDRAPTLLDVFGPVMIGPSSSHTAGVARLALLARRVLGAQIEAARVTFFGSLAKTYRGHGSDKAAIAGLLGIHPEDERLGFAPELARRAGLAVEIRSELEAPAHYHPNTMVVELEGGGRRLRLRGASVGGGSVLVQSVNGYRVELEGRLDALLVGHRDEPGVIAAVAGLLAGSGYNIASMGSHRRDKGDEALLVVELDGTASESIVAGASALRGVLDVAYVPAVGA